MKIFLVVCRRGVEIFGNRNSFYWFLVKRMRCLIYKEVDWMMWSFLGKFFLEDFRIGKIIFVLKLWFLI